MAINPDYILIFILFILLSPQLLVTLPDLKAGELLSAPTAKVSYTQALVHAVIFIICHHYLGNAALRAMDLIPQTETKEPTLMIGVMDLVCGTLFFLLIPGVLLTLPPVNMNTNNITCSHTTTIPSVVVHAFVFVLAHHYVVAGMHKLGFNEP